MIFCENSFSSMPLKAIKVFISLLASTRGDFQNFFFRNDKKSRNFRCYDSKNLGQSGLARIMWRQRQTNNYSDDAVNY